MPRSRLSQLAAFVALVLVAVVVAFASLGEGFGGRGGDFGKGDVADPVGLEFHFGW